jgi:hypothetical protein
MHRQTQYKALNLSVVLILVAALIVPVLLFQRAHAAALTQVLVRFDRMAQSSFTSGMVCAKPATAGTETTVKVTFPTGFTVSSTTGNWTVSTAVTSNWPSGATAWLGINTATTASGQDVTFPSTDLVVGTLYCFNWTNTAAALQQPSSTGASELGVVTTQATGPATIDSAQFSTATINPDQISVTATVPQVFTFSLANTTDSMGSLSSGSVKTSTTPPTATVGTNAKNGWQLWAKSNAANGGLVSSSASYTIPSNCNGGTQVGTNATLSAGTEGYNTGLTSNHAAGGSGTITVATPFVGGSTGKGGGLCGTLQTLATSSGTAVGDVLTLTNNVAISNATAAATDYSDTITVVGAGLF